MNDILRKGIENTEKDILDILDNRGANWVSEIAIFSFVKNNKYFRNALGNLITSNKIQVTTVELPILKSNTNQTVPAKLYRKCSNYN